MACNVGLARAKVARVSDDEWIEVLVPSPVALADGLANELVESVAAARSGVQVRKGVVVFWVKPDALEESLDQARACLRGLADSGWLVDPAKIKAGALAPEDEWRDAWKKYFHVTRLTRQIVVVPSWEKYQALVTDLPIVLDPGQAFGTGAHASTQLVLEHMQELVDANHPAPERVLDLGTGSGILAIAAAKFWPRTRIVATDIDPLSIRATNENAEINAVAAQIDVSTTALNDLTGDFPLVLANIQAHTLRDLRDDLLPTLAPGARLLLSGILSSQIEPLVEFYVASEMVELVAVRRSALNPDWSSAHLRRA